VERENLFGPFEDRFSPSRWSDMETFYATLTADNYHTMKRLLSLSSQTKGRVSNI
jgi:hypothetical protein